MATRIEEFTTRRAHYPWDEWTDGSKWQVVQGEDFFGEPKVFRAQLYHHAHRHKMSCTTRQESITLKIDGKNVKVTVVEFRFSDPA